MIILTTVLISTLIFVASLQEGFCDTDSDPEISYSQQAEVAILVDDISKLNGNNKWNAKCNWFECFNVLQCEINPERQLLYYVYPPLTFLDRNENLLYETKSMITYEYWQILKKILGSSRITLNPERACLFVPSIDLVHLSKANFSMIASLYENLAYWNSVDGKPGTNHLVITLDPTQNLNQLQPAIGRAMLISSNHDTWTYRPEFDYSIPIVSAPERIIHEERRIQWKLVSTQFNSIDDRQQQSIAKLENLMKGDFLILGHKCNFSGGARLNGDDEYLSCSSSSGSTKTLPMSSNLEQMDKTTCRCSKDGQLDFRFPQLLASSQYCLIMHIRNYPSPMGDSSHYLLGQAIRYGCVPIVTNDLSLPYGSIVNWNEISFPLTNEYSLESVINLISSIDLQTYWRMSSKAQEVWSNHFQTPSQVASNIMHYYDGIIYPRILLNNSLCDS